MYRQEYQKNPHKILIKKYKCTYTIKNPKLNNVVQEHTEFFYFSVNGELEMRQRKDDLNESYFHDYFSLFSRFEAEKVLNIDYLQ